ncbi:KamA family radical SAM protein [Chitinophaga sp. 22321]|uniref:KamA family protein n=1 Tax=Chitinophaga hostae TaxID=2831022 RepID=A0ABS5JB08_9BACT|nr:hypothetical protein [Chitinophaga hostae]MBS0031772.1 hypothetical protein [Chitinophaga hostae]
MNYRSYSLANFEHIPQVRNYLSKDDIDAVKIIGSVLPFKINNYLVNELIDWDNFRNDPIYHLTFPQYGMLSGEDYILMQQAIARGANSTQLAEVASNIRKRLNPHPGEQLTLNVPVVDGSIIKGMQHKYDQTVLFFPSHGQTCHAYCTFCFRWPQFVGDTELKFASREVSTLLSYVRSHPKVTDILFTGGDPMIMSARMLMAYLEPIIEADLPNLSTIRIGTKVLGYWPYRFLTDTDADELLRFFDRIAARNINLALMAHVNHPKELQHPAAQKAIRRVLNTGVQIRTQSPILNHINKSAETWRDMWNLQVKLGCIPYYMFIARDTGAQDYFSVTLEESSYIFNEAYRQVSGLGRTVRGPSMSVDTGKIEVMGVTEIKGEKVFQLRLIQCRNAAFVGKIFYAKYNPDAIWFSDLEPAFGETGFFFEDKKELLNL